MKKALKPDFNFDTNRGSSLVLIISASELPEFDSNKFIKRYYSINTLKDEGETQSYNLLDNFKTIKKIKGKFSFGFDYVKISAKEISQFIEELISQNFGEVWVCKNGKYQIAVDLNNQNEVEIHSSLCQILGTGKLDTDGIVFRVVAF